VAIGTVVTIFIICASYSQLVELFPTGGGGYLVASKLLSPTVGMVSGCALLIDYVLTIAVSIASGADAFFSILPAEWYPYKLTFAVIVILVLTVMNMRGVKESVLILAPIFVLFLVTHVFVIIYALCTHLPNLPQVASSTAADMRSTLSSVGFLGMAFIILRAYSMGAGTYTGLEAVSNGMPVLREPKVQTAKITLRYMAFSLSFIVIGLMLAYLFYSVAHQPGKTLNAVLFEQVTAGWGSKFSYIFVLVTLISEATLLFVAAQTGFLSGPWVLANMAKDRWFPVRFSSLSDRLVTQNGILIMSGLALILMVISRGSVHFLVILYSINVFITFVLSQLGMVRHWWQERSQAKGWLKKLCINGVGLVLSASILVTMVVFKFFEGGWITLLITGALITLAILIRRHYLSTMKMLHRLNHLVSAAETSEAPLPQHKIEETLEAGTFDTKAKTAVMLVNGFNGMGLHTLFGVIRLFGGAFKNFVFLEVGVVDSGNFKGAQELSRLKNQVHTDLSRYVRFMKKQGFYAQGISSTGVDAIDEIINLAPDVAKRFPNSVFFGGQLIFPKDSFITRVLHNYTVFTLQRRLYREGIPFVILPIRV
jgi:amino acid transporter